MEPANAWAGIDHVQLAMPSGAEEVARDFYVRVLGLAEVPKPPLRARRGWSDEIPGVTRCHVADPFGNRIELVDAEENGSR